MKDESFNYHISAKLKPNDHPLTNYCHFNDPTRKMHIRIKQLCICFYCFLIDTYLMINFVTKIDTDRKY